MKVTQHTSVDEYLELCEERGANSEGDCPSFEWARSSFGGETPMGEALRLLKDHHLARETSLFAFGIMLRDLDEQVRVMFAEIVSDQCSHAVQAWAWAKMVSAGIEASPYEDRLLRGRWHSKWQGKSLLPNAEEV